MFFKKKPDVLETPMDQFLRRETLSTDERAILEVYLTGAIHALGGANVVQTSNKRDPLFKVQGGRELTLLELENMIAEFLKQRPDMQSQPLGLCAAMAVMQRFSV